VRPAGRTRKNGPLGPFSSLSVAVSVEPCQFFFPAFLTKVKFTDAFGVTRVSESKLPDHPVY
jgi:hypothetical protein